MLNYESIAEEYARHRQVHPEVLRSLIQLPSLHSASQVLEVGCGTGNYITALERAVGCRCWGIDPSERMLAKATEKSKTTRFQIGNAEKLAFADESFDLIFSVDVIHHVTDRTSFLRDAYRVLRQHGRVCTVTDSEEIIRHRQPLAAYFPETVEADLTRYPSVTDLRQMMEGTGFRQVAEVAVEFPYPLTDIAAYRDKAFSCLHLISADAHRRGIERMERDLMSGPLQGNSRYLLLWGTKPNTFEITPEDVCSDAAVRLISELSGELARRYDHVDDGSGHFRPEDVGIPRSVFLIGRLAGEPVACGAVRPLEGDVAEVKRMYVVPAMRGRGFSKRLLVALEEAARNMGYVAIRLETGDRQPEAIRLYESAGYQRIEPFGIYVGSGRSVCFEKRLEFG